MTCVLIRCLSLLLVSIAPVPVDGRQAPVTDKVHAQDQDGAAKPAEKPAKAPIDHLRAARASVDEIAGETLTTDAADTLKEVKARLATLEATYVSHGRKSVSTEQTPSGSTRVRIAQRGTWTSQVPEIDKLLGHLVDPRHPVAREPQQDGPIKRTFTAARSHLTAFARGASGTTGSAR